MLHARRAGNRVPGLPIALLAASPRRFDLLTVRVTR